MLKKKNVYVIATTVLITLLVSVSAFLGFIIYLQWQKLNSVFQYYETVGRLDTISYTKNIEVGPSRIGLGFKNIPIVEGTIKNRGKRSIIAITIKLNFLDIQNNAIFSYTIHPLEPIQPPAFFKKIHFTRFTLLKEPILEPNSTTIFRCVLWKCKKKFIKMMRRNSFSNNPGEWCGKIEGKVIQLRLKPT